MKMLALLFRGPAVERNHGKRDRAGGCGHDFLTNRFAIVVSPQFGQRLDGAGLLLRENV